MEHNDEGIYYVIEGVEIALVTEGDTIEDALRNLREAVELYFEDEVESPFWHDSRPLE